MVSTPSSTSSSCSLISFGSLEDVTVNKIKFLCSYGGKILPRPVDGTLRYVGGETRVLAVDRSITFSDLELKMKQLCGWSRVSLRCQLPTEDLDALVSVTSDEDLANLIEEYDLANNLPLKIRAFLHPPKPFKASTSPTNMITRSQFARCAHQAYLPTRFSMDVHHQKDRQYRVHHANHWHKKLVVN